MSRRSSFGYSSYRPRSYRSGGYGGRHRKGGKSAVIAISIIALILMAAAVPAIYFAFMRDKGHEEIKEQTSTASSYENSLHEVSELSAASKEESAQSSAPESSPDPDIEGYHDGNVFMYDRSGYEMFYGTDGSAQNYADIVSAVKAAVGKDVKVYNMVVPNHAPFGLPEKYLSQMNDEKENIKKIYSSYTEDVTPIDVFAAENDHRSEYTYFKTDHNWTALGAYYAYQEFCKAANTKAIELSSLSKGNITGFRGSLFAATRTDENPDGNKELSANPDTVIYYNMPCIESCILLENGKTEEQEVPIIASFAEGSNSYSAFIWGNNPYMKVTTTQKTGRKLCIIKDSYGCAFAPFVTANYDEVFIVDPSFYEGNAAEYIINNKYTDVLIINSVMNANTSFKANDIMTIIK